MTEEKMTIHKALCELKLLDARIQKAARECTYVLANRHSNIKIAGRPIDDVKEEMTSAYQSVEDMIKRRNAIKRAVVLSNATTHVDVNGLDMTIAEAIDMKNHGMDGYKTILAMMGAQFASAWKIIEANSGEPLQKKAETYVMGMLGSKEKVDSEVAKKMTEEYISANSYDLIDPIKVKETMGELDALISGFESEVDAALSVSNAITEITVTY